MKRFFSDDDLGPQCRHCHHRVPRRIATDQHPTCGPDARALMLRDDLATTEEA